MVTTWSELRRLVQERLCLSFYLVWCTSTHRTRLSLVKAQSFLCLRLLENSRIRFKSNAISSAVDARLQVSACTVVHPDTTRSVSLDEDAMLLSPLPADSLISSRVMSSICVEWHTLSSTRLIACSIWVSNLPSERSSAKSDQTDRHSCSQLPGHRTFANSHLTSAKPTPSTFRSVAWRTM